MKNSKSKNQSAETKICKNKYELKYFYHVRVGSEVSPASEKDIEDVEKSFLELSNKNNLIVHEHIDLIRLYLGSSNLHIIRVGTIDNPSTDEDIIAMQEMWTKFKNEYNPDKINFFVTNHAVEIMMIQK